MRIGKSNNLSTARYKMGETVIDAKNSEKDLGVISVHADPGKHINNFLGSCE